MVFMESFQIFPILYLCKLNLVEVIYKMLTFMNNIQTQSMLIQKETIVG